jgi:photosystem II stability/assembly factor-like uncharacterized protein
MWEFIWYFLVPLFFYPSTGESNKKPSDWFVHQRSYPYDSIPQSIYRKAALEYKEAKNYRSKQPVQDWKFAGPVNVGGRITDIEASPIRPQLIYVGAASGGVFKSVNGGESWRSIFDSNPILSIGDMALDHHNPDKLWVGTGEANGGGGSVAYDGNGLFLTEDGGDSWLYKGLEGAGSISKILVHPQNPNILYVAAMGSLFGKNQMRGIYKTSNGGNTWDQIYFHSDSVGVIDLALDPVRPDTLYAATWERSRRPRGIDYGGPGCGVIRSFDGGKVWVKLQAGLPGGNDLGRIGLAVAPTNSTRIIAFYVDESGDFLGVYRSDDAGHNWVRMAGRINVANFGWWFGKIYFDQVNPNIVYGLGLTGSKSINGGNLFVPMTENFNEDVHVDQHALYIYPDQPERILLGNDGGLYASKNAGGNWSKINNLPITQFYTCHIDYNNPERLYGGSQDNSSIRTFSTALDQWNIFNGGDGFVCLVDPQDNRFVYTESQYGAFVRSTDGGQTFFPALEGMSSVRTNWNTPVVFHPKNSSILFYGADRLFKSENRAETWFPISPVLTPETGSRTFGTITTISVSALDPNIIYIGTDLGLVWLTKDGGLSWNQIQGNLPTRWITSIHADPFSKNKVYLTISGYRFNESMPHVYGSDDQGMNWRNLSRGLPPVPCNKILVDPLTPGHLIVGTDLGVWRSMTDGTTWQPLGDKMPPLVISDLHFHAPSRKLLAATYGRGMYTYDLEIQVNTTDKPLQYLAAVAPNPVQGDQVNLYWPLGAPTREVKVEIHSLQGQQMIGARSVRMLPGSIQAISFPGPQGIYLLSISAPLGVHQTIRIIKN